MSITPLIPSPCWAIGIKTLIFQERSLIPEAGTAGKPSPLPAASLLPPQVEHAVNGLGILLKCSF